MRGESENWSVKDTTTEVDYKMEGRSDQIHGHMEVKSVDDVERYTDLCDTINIGAQYTDYHQEVPCRLA